MRLWPFGKRDMERKYSAVGPNIARMYVGQAVWSPRNYENFTREGYQQNAIAFRAIKMVAQSAASVPMVLYDRRGEEVEEHPLLTLLDRPSGAYSRAEFFEAVFAYLLIAGNSYIEAVGPERGEPKELWPLRPDRMQIIPGRYGFPEGYRYTVNGIPKDWRANPINGFGPILHMKDFNPLDDWYGMSRIEAAAYGIDRHNAASAHNKALLDNGARPSGALVFKPVKLEDGTYSSAPQSMVDAAKDKLIEGNAGPENAGKPMVFTGDVSWEEMGISPKDMDFGEGKNDAARDMLAALGVPAMLLIPGESTYSNRAEANLELYERTVIPLVLQLVDALNSWLCPRFGDGLSLGIDMDGISALEPRREGRRKGAKELFDSGLIDRNEARAMLQYGEAGADFIEKPDAQIIAQLSAQQMLDTAGDVPLFEYMKRTGLIPATTTLDAFRSLVLGFLTGDDGDALDALEEDSSDADEE